MKIPILTVRDDNGNEIPIPAIKGKDGITPHIGKNGNWTAMTSKMSMKMGQ